MLSRSAEPITEWEIGKQTQDLIHGKKNIYALCSSTNIDRIAEFYNANHADNKERRFVVDKYQREVLDVITKLHGGCTGFYKFDYAVWRNPWYPAHNDELEQRGFFALIRGNGSRFEKEMLERYFNPSNSLLIYSMWDGYLKPGVAANDKHIALYEKYQPHEILHTSGHASQGALTELYRLIKPKRGLIPIHTEFPDLFADIIPDGNIIRVNDGEVKVL
jgi:ribonuclease J